MIIATGYLPLHEHVGASHYTSDYSVKLMLSKTSQVSNMIMPESYINRHFMAVKKTSQSSCLGNKSKQITPV